MKLDSEIVKVKEKAKDLKEFPVDKMRSILEDSLQEKIRNEDQSKKRLERAQKEK